MLHSLASRGALQHVVLPGGVVKPGNVTMRQDYYNSPGIGSRTNVSRLYLLPDFKGIATTLAVWRRCEVRGGKAAQLQFPWNWELLLSL